MAVLVDALGVSRHHARIVVDGDRVTLEDLGSKNGTFLRGQPLEGSAELTNGDEFQLGRTTLVFRSSAWAGPTETE